VLRVLCAVARVRSAAGVASDDARAQRSPSPRAVTRGEFDSPRVVPFEKKAGFAVVIDWLSFTYFPADGHWRHALAHFLDANFKVGRQWERGGAWRGYEQSARVGGCLVAWGGASQRGTVYVDIPGNACSQCSDFRTVGEWLEFLKARITRVDVAGDDFEGNIVTVDWALAQWRGDGFSGRGTKPSAKLIDELNETSGRTLYVGRRANGKLACIYEKGKQLGDALSRWCRFEVRWGSKDRVIPYEVLYRPAHFLAGAFRCAGFFADVVERIRTFKERASISYGRMVQVARLHCGRAINAMLQVSQGDLGAVVSLLRRSGLPARLDAADMMRLTAREGTA
jgi:phage replication initiation protein